MARIVSVLPAMLTIPPDSLVQTSPYGLFVPAAQLYLDAPWAPGAVYISHAHADHSTSADRIVCSPETAALHAARRGQREVQVVPFGTAVRCADAELRLHSASHCLGAALLEVRCAAGVLVYTGDFKLRSNPFTPPCVVPPCDELIMECTFGEPRYRFPPDAQLVKELVAFVARALAEGATPVVLAYALGKGQEALYHLTSHGFDVAVHGAIANMCRLHVELGYPFPGPGIWTPYRRGEIGARALLTTPGTRNTAMVQGLSNRRVVYLTGWAQHPGAHNMYKGVDLVLPLSDHADYDDLIQTARASSARRIFTVHGPASFARRLVALGFDARHLADHPQSVRVDEQHSLELL